MTTANEGLKHKRAEERDSVNNNNKYLNIIHINIGRKGNKVGSKHTEIDTTMEKYKGYDVIGITEAGLIKEDKYLEEKYSDYRIWYTTNTPNNNDSVMIMVKKAWKVQEIQTGMTRSKSVKINVESNKSLFIHLVYGPHKDKEGYWGRWETYLQKQGTRDTIIMGDLNELLTPNLDKTKRGKQIIMKQSILQEIITALGLIDGFREKHGGKKEYTMTKVYKDGEVSMSRIDHFLFDNNTSEIVKDLQIRDFNKNMSDHHHAITMTLEYIKPLKADQNNPPAEITLIKINTKVLEENKQTYQQAVKELIRINSIIKGETCAKDKFIELTRILWKTGEAVAGTTKVTINSQKTETRNHRIDHLTKQITNLSKAQASAAHLQQKAEATTKIKAILNDFPNSNGDWKRWRVSIKEELNKLKKEKERETNHLRSKLIQQRIEKIRKSGYSKSPKLFWSKAKPKPTKKSLTRVIQQNGERTAEPNLVKNTVAQVWEEIFSKVEIDTSTEKQWHRTKAFQEMKQRIHEREANPETSSSRPISLEEMKEALAKINKKDRAPGPDNLPNELFTFVTEEIAELLTQIYNEFLETNTIPEEWRDSKIFLIYKEGPTSNEENPRDYRPISLLNVAYKLMAIIIDLRLRSLSEDLISNEQGGFRNGRSCIQKISILTNCLEDAKLFNKPIYLCYLDVAKAYDTTSIKAVLDLLKRLNFGKKIRRIIKNINLQCQTSVITPYGETHKFKIGNGLRQGCPLSPLLYILFLDPLLKWLNEEEIGYTLEGKDDEAKSVTLNNLAWADDQVLITNNPHNLQKLLNQTATFMNHYGLELNLGKNKTTHTSLNASQPFTLHYKRKERKSGETSFIEVPHLEEHEAYRYLGVWITADLNWTKQKEMITKMIAMNLEYLKWRAITPEQKVTIINMVLIPAIEYRLQAIRFEDKTLQGWDRWIGRAICRMYGLHHNDGYLMAYFPAKKGGLGLRKIQNLQTINLTSTVITFGLNGKDNDTRRVIEAKLNTSKTPAFWHETNKLLSKLGIEMERGKQMAYKGDEITPYLASDPVIKKLFHEHFTKNGTDPETKSIHKYFNNRGQPQSLLEAAKSNSWRYNHTYKNLYDSALKILTDNGNESRKQMIEILRKGRGGIEKEQFEVDLSPNETEEWRNAWTDGSLMKNPNKAGSSFCTSSDKQKGIHFYSRTATYQNSYAAEIYAIWIALELAATNFNLRIFSDNKSAITIIQKAMTKGLTQKEIRNDPNAPTIEEICKQIREREGKTELQHVYSHTLDLERGVSKVEKKRRINEMRKQYGKDWRRVAMGNLIADELAKKGTDEKEVSNNINNERKGWITNKGEQFSTGIRTTLKKAYLQMSTIEANMYTEKRRGMSIEEKNIPILNQKNEEDAELRVFAIKATWNKLPTAARTYNQLPNILQSKNLNSSRKRKLEETYQSPNCTFGCQEKETQKHIWTCKNNPMKTLEEGIRPLLKKLGKKRAELDWDKEQTWLNTISSDQSPWKDYSEKAVESLILPNNVNEFFNKDSEGTPPNRLIHRKLLTLARKRWQATCDNRHKKDPLEQRKKRKIATTRRKEEERKTKERREKNEKTKRKRQKETFEEYMKQIHFIPPPTNQEENNNQPEIQTNARTKRRTEETNTTEANKKRRYTLTPIYLEMSTE